MRIAVVVLFGSHIYGLGLKGARVPTSDKKDALAAAYRTINEADAETTKQVVRRALRYLKATL